MTRQRTGIQVQARPIRWVIATSRSAVRTATIMPTDIAYILQQRIL